MPGIIADLFDQSRTARLNARGANRLLGHIAIALLVFTVFAFAAKVIVHPERAARYTPLVSLHGVAMLAWMGLLASQAYLASANRMKWHRAMGNASISLVALMSVTGAMVAIGIAQEFGRPEVAIVNIAAFVTFIPLYFVALASARRRDMHTHRQAMLIGTLAFMTPVYARVTDILGLPPQVAIGVQPPLTIAMALGYEWWVLNRLTKATLWMLGYSVGLVVIMVGVLAIWFI